MQHLQTTPRGAGRGSGATPSEVFRVETAGARIATQTFGSRDDPALMLVMGATASMLGWPDEFCTDLAERGLFVIRFDHRDTGQSTTVPPGQAGYTVEDMAGDAVAILDAIGAPRAHLMGMSLGGYLAQMIALQDPRRIGTLTLLASEPLGWDGPDLPHISGAILDHFGGLGSLDWSDRRAVSEFLLQTERLCAGSGQPFDEARAEARIDEILDRTESPASMFNHATLATREDWAGRFREISQPVLVIHGEEDPVLPHENGQAIAAGVASAELLSLPGVGHELPPSHSATIADRAAAHVRRVP